MTRRDLLVSGLALALPHRRLFTFHVLGLLYPRRLLIRAQQHARLRVQTRRDTKSLEGSQILDIVATDVPALVTSWDGEACNLSIEVPGWFRRNYRGTLRIQNDGDLLVPILTMDLETAVSSITGAEMPVSAVPRAALMAQAVVARSFLLAAGPRHNGYDFCDTTHCQFLRSPAIPNSPVDQAVRQTASLTLHAQGVTIPCRYSASCGGHTDQREELGYRYQSVKCEGCLLNHYARRGHGLGLCQEGAIHLARKGWNYDRILALYLPASHLTSAI